MIDRKSSKQKHKEHNIWILRNFDSHKAEICIYFNQLYKICMLFFGLCYKKRI